MTPDPNAALAALLAATPPHRREAVLIRLMRHTADALRVIRGVEHTSEEVYRIADNLIREPAK